MRCPKPCRQMIRGANKMCVHGIWKHKRCPHTVWQPEEIANHVREAMRLRDLLFSPEVEVET